MERHYCGPASPTSDLFLHNLLRLTKNTSEVQPCLPILPDLKPNDPEAERPAPHVHAYRLPLNSEQSSQVPMTIILCPIPSADNNVNEQSIPVITIS
jgi:hypothetical protein